ncbi:MAG: hypothetical protein R3F34_15390 [Planctomycetota bacterium]
MAAIDDKPATGVLFVVSAVTVLIFTIGAVASAALAAWGERAEYARKVEGRPSYELTQLKQEQHHQLENYGWTDRENGLARIPIQQAKERFLAEQH